MDSVLYTASPLRAFTGLIVMTLFFFALGLLSAWTSISGRRDHILKRLGAGCAGLILHWVNTCKTLNMPGCTNPHRLLRGSRR